MVEGIAVMRIFKAGFFVIEGKGLSQQTHERVKIVAMLIDLSFDQRKSINTKDMRMLRKETNTNRARTSSSSVLHWEALCHAQPLQISHRREEEEFPIPLTHDQEHFLQARVWGTSHIIQSEILSSPSPISWSDVFARHHALWFSMCKSNQAYLAIIRWMSLRWSYLLYLRKEARSFRGGIVKFDLGKPRGSPARPNPPHFRVLAKRKPEHLKQQLHDLLASSLTFSTWRIFWLAEERCSSRISLSRLDPADEDPGHVDTWWSAEIEEVLEITNQHH